MFWLRNKVFFFATHSYPKACSNNGSDKVLSKLINWSQILNKKYIYKMMQMGTWMNVITNGYLCGFLYCNLNTLVAFFSYVASFIKSIFATKFNDLPFLSVKTQ